jgi:hypothetical protein
MKIYLLAISLGYDLMDYGQIIFRKRTDLGKVYVFLPKTGRILEAKSSNVTVLYNLLELMRFASVRELNELNDANNRGLLKGQASEAFDVYSDLKSLQVGFKDNTSAVDVLKKYIKRHGGMIKTDYKKKVKKAELCSDKSGFKTR